jgi:hypothetical protein
MKLRILCPILALGMAVGANPAHAQTFDPCSVYLCMAGIAGAGASGGPACTVPIAFWHTTAPAGLAVYDEEGFDAPASLAARQTYLMTCPGAQVSSNAGILSAIIAEWGSVP